MIFVLDVKCIYRFIFLTQLVIFPHSKMDDAPAPSVVKALVAETSAALRREAIRPQDMHQDDVLVDGARKPVCLQGTALRWYWRLLSLVTSHSCYMEDAVHMSAHLEAAAVVDAHRLLVMRITAMAKFFGELADALGCIHLGVQASIFENQELQSACNFLLADPLTDDMLHWDETLPAVFRLAYATGVSINTPDSHTTIGMMRSALVVHSALVETYFRSVYTLMPLMHEMDADVEMLTLYSMVPEVAEAVALVCKYVLLMKARVSHPPMWVILAVDFIEGSGCAMADELVKTHKEEIARDGNKTASPLYWMDVAIDCIVCSSGSLFYVEWPHPNKLSDEDYRKMKERSESGTLDGFDLFDALATHRRIMTDVLDEESKKDDLRMFLRLVAMTISTIVMDVCEDASQLFAHLTKADVDDSLDEACMEELRQAFEGVGIDGDIKALYAVEDDQEPKDDIVARPISTSPLFSILPEELMSSLCHPPAIEDAPFQGLFDSPLDLSGWENAKDLDFLDTTTQVFI